MKKHEQIEICETCTYHRIIYGKGIVCAQKSSFRALDKFCKDFDFSPNYSQREINSFVELQEKRGITVPERIKNKTTDDVITPKDISTKAPDNIESTDILDTFDIENYVWVKKSEEEIENEYYDKYSILGRLKKSIKGGTIAFFVTILLRIIMLLTIGPSFENASSAYNPGLPTGLRFQDLLDYKMNYLWLGLIGFAVICLYLFFAQVFYKESLPTFICDKCKDKRIQKSIGEECECGGVFYSSNDYKMEYKNNS